MQALPYWQSIYAYELWRRLRCADQVRDHRPQPSPSDSHTMSLSICVCARFLLSFVAAAAGATFKVVFTLRESGK